MLAAIWLNFKLGSVKNKNAARVRITLHLQRQQLQLSPKRQQGERAKTPECFP